MKKSIFLNIFFLINFIQFSHQNKSICPIGNSHSNYVNIDNFDTFSDINFTECAIQNNISVLNIQPDKSLILDKTPNFTGLVLRNIQTQYFGLLFNDIKGIDLRFNPFQNIIMNKDLEFNVALKISRFDFYVNQKLIDKKICNVSLSYEITGNVVQYYYETFLNNLTILVLHSTVKLSKETCPFIFKSAKIGILNIKMVQSSFIYENVLSFSEITDSFGQHLDSIVFQLMLKLYRVKLDSSILNKYVFEQIIVLDLNGIISSFQTDLFKSFSYLKILRIRTQNVQNLLTHNNKWIQYLNYNVHVNLNDQNEVTRNLNKLFFLLIFQTYSNVTFYDYPDKDFCFFSDFPHHKLIVPILKPIFKSKCSCTELFLIRHSYQLKNDILFNLDQIVSDYYDLVQFYKEEINEREYSICTNSSIELTIFECDFLSRLRKCKINSTISASLDSDNNVNWYMTDWYKLSEYSYFSFTIYINPFFSIISILLNSLIIIIYSSRFIEKDMKNAYKYLVVNCYTNIFYVILLVFQIFFTNCLFDAELFCSRKTDSWYVNYFEKIFTNLIEKALHTFSNLSYLWFIIFRYIRITNKSNEIVNVLKKCSLKTFLLVGTFFSFLINLYAFFEHDKATNQVFIKIEVSQPNDNFKTNLSQTEYLIFNFFQYIKIIFADLLLIVLIILIDIRLSFFIQKQISRSTESLGISQRALKKKKNSQNRINAMIIWNGINFFFLRLPSSLIDIFGLLFSYNKQNEYSYQLPPDKSSYIVCRLFIFCSSLKEIFYFLYLLSFTFQFFIFYKLDKNFNESMMNIKKRINLFLNKIKTVFYR